MTDNDPEVILFETSPYRNIDAIVQHDGRVVYFYLNGHAVGDQNPFGTRAVWVRNLIEGPYVLDEDEARAGIAPLLPRTHCKDPKPQPLPDANHLKVIWFEEGNGAALVKTDPNTGRAITLAVLPPWSGLEGFHGYADGCAAESPLCWPLPDNPKLQQRIDQAAAFWSECESESHPFADLQSSVLSAYRDAFSISDLDQEQYFSIDGGQFPPRGLVNYPTLGVIATVGLSLCPQPAVELFTDEPTAYRRIELAIQLTAEQMADAELVESASKQLSGLAAYPWRNLTWFGPGHSCGLAGIQPDSQVALLVPDAHRSSGAQTAAVKIPDFRADPVNLLWLTPITPEQQRQLEAGEITGEQVIATF